MLFSIGDLWPLLESAGCFLLPPHITSIYSRSLSPTGAHFTASHPTVLPLIPLPMPSIPSFRNPSLLTIPSIDSQIVSWPFKTIPRMVGMVDIASRVRCQSSWKESADPKMARSSRKCGFYTLVKSQFYIELEVRMLSVF